MVNKPLKIGLALGSATSLFADVDAALALTECDIVVAANEAGVAYSGRLSAWVSLHPNEMAARLRRREQRGHPPCGVIVSHVTDKEHPGVTHQAEYKFPGQSKSGSSGLFAVKYALDLGCTHVICCGIPIESDLGRIDGRINWQGARHFKQGWFQAKPVIKDKVRSMSGWTSQLLGKPTAEWLQQSR